LFAGQRSALLEEIRRTFFAGAKPEHLLYLGAGGDVANPSVMTRASNLTLVDSTAFNVEGIKNTIRGYHGANVRIAETVEAGVVTRLTVRDREGETVLQTVDLRRMGYQAYLDGHPQQADVLFDKDSWLKDAGPKVVADYAAKLKPNGLWISNFDLGGPELTGLFDMVGMVNVTPRLREPFDKTTFGNANIEVRQRQQHFNQGAFNVLGVFAHEVNVTLSLFNYPGYTFGDEAEKADSIQKVTNAFGKAMVGLIGLEDFPAALALEFVNVGRRITGKLSAIGIF